MGKSHQVRGGEAGLIAVGYSISPVLRRVRSRPPRFDSADYKQRNTVERAISKLKQFRAVATRYDKRAYIFAGTVDVASIRIWLRDPVP